MSLLLLGGDIAQNPGPRNPPVYKRPCGNCSKPVKKTQQGLQCDNCDMWNHTKKIGMSDAVYEALSNQAPGSEQWFCEECMPTEDPIKGISDDEEDPIATPVNDHNNQSAVNDSEWCDNHSDIFNEYKMLRSKAGKSPIFAHININSYKYKFMDLAQIFQNKFSDIFMISETKLDDFYPTAQFDHPRYNIYRKDRNKNGGGILVYTRAYCPSEDFEY